MGDFYKEILKSSLYPFFYGFKEICFFAVYKKWENPHLNVGYLIKPTQNREIDIKGFRVIVWLKC